MKMVSRTLTVNNPEGLHMRPAGVVAKEMGKFARSEERRVGKECRSRWSPYH